MSIWTRLAWAIYGALLLLGVVAMLAAPASALVGPAVLIWVALGAYYVAGTRWLGRAHA